MKNTLLIFSMAIIAMSCSKNDAPITYSFNAETISIYSLDSAKLVITPTPKDNPIFKSSDMRIAQYKDNGYVGGIVAGEAVVTTDIEGQTLSCKVTVKTKTSLCTEPYMGFGSTMSVVKANETRSIRSQTTTRLTYSDPAPNVSYIAYVFENGVLKSSGIVLPLSLGGDAMKFLTERYVLIGSDSVDTFFFESLDKTIKVGLQISYPECVIGYFKNTTARSISEEDLLNRIGEIANR